VRPVPALRRVPEIRNSSQLQRESVSAARKFQSTFLVMCAGRRAGLPERVAGAGRRTISVRQPSGLRLPVTPCLTVRTICGKPLMRFVAANAGVSRGLWDVGGTLLLCGAPAMDRRRTRSALHDLVQCVAVRDVDACAPPVLNSGRNGAYERGWFWLSSPDTQPKGIDDLSVRSGAASSPGFVPARQARRGRRNI